MVYIWIYAEYNNCIEWANNIIESLENYELKYDMINYNKEWNKIFELIENLTYDL